MNYKKVAFVGMMGSGKTTVSKIYAKEKEIPLYELDELFEEKFGSIREYFSKFSEEKFRVEESKILFDITKNDKFILSTGGGVVLNSKNREILFDSDIFSIYIKTSAQIIYERIKTDTTRPLLLVKNPQDEIKKIIKKREEYYSMANLIISADNKTPDEIVKEIINYERNHDKNA